jgi:hypothetical protein
MNFLRFPFLLLLAIPLAVPARDKVLIIGDSLSKEYEITFRGVPGIAGICPDNPKAWKARNWAETLHRLRNPWFDMGSVNWYADFRVYGHRYNWAFASGKASQIRDRLLSDDLFDRFWQSTLWDALKNDADRVVLFCGGNDINSRYGDLYEGTRTADEVIAPIRRDIAQVLAKIRSKDSKVPIVLVSVPHPGTSPSVRADHPYDPVRTGRVTTAVNRLNNQLKILARQFNTGFADITSPTRRMVNGSGLFIAGVPFFNKAHPDSHPRFLFACDGFHPGTALQGGIAAIILDAFQAKYPVTGLNPLTEREILQKVLRLDPDLAFKLWARARGLSGTDAVMSADSDGDGLDQLTEMAFNLNPRVADANRLPAATTRDLNGQPYATITWRELPRYAGYISITPQYADGVGPWQDVPPAYWSSSPNGTQVINIPRGDEPIRFSFLVGLVGVDDGGQSVTAP